MQYKITVLSPWVGNGGPMEDSFRPQFGDDYSYVSWAELSVRPCSEYCAAPNMGVIEATVDDIILATLEADSDYYIMTCEEVLNAGF